MPVISLPYQYVPRPYQLELLDAFFNKRIKRMFYIVHRRGGKDLTSFNLMIAAACERVGTYLYLLPQLNQARRVIWTSMTGDGVKFLSRIPEQIVSKINNSEMSITLINGSRILFGGSDNINALMGMNPVGIVMSEFPLHSPLAYPLLSPILRENNGWMLLNGTPRGHNHAHELYNHIRDNPEWFVRILSIDKTFLRDGSRILNDADMESERRGGMAEELIQQEFYCSWSSGNLGAYYTAELEACERENRICDIKPSMAPVYTFWDIGFDATSIWGIQPKGKQINVLFHVEHVDKDMTFMVNTIRDIARQLNIQFKDHIGPHDIRNREWAGGRSRIEIAQQMGITFRVCPKIGVDDGIQAVKALFPKLYFDRARCHLGLQSLREYRREYDDDKKIYSGKPLHNWASHASDALRYFAIYWQDLYMRPQDMAAKPYSMDAFVMERDKPQAIDPVQAQFKSVLEGVKSNLRGNK